MKKFYLIFLGALGAKQQSTVVIEQNRAQAMWQGKRCRALMN
jgi:hypothetical protein